MARWQRIDRIDGDPNNIQTTVLDHDDARGWHIEVRRESQCVHGPRRVAGHVAESCIERYGFRTVK